MTKICLIGYGKMGKMLHQLAESKACQVVSIIDPGAGFALSRVDLNNKPYAGFDTSRVDLNSKAAPLLPKHASEITLDSLQNVDVAIDFSHPAAAISNLERLIELKQNLVVGTTGWHDQLAEISAKAEQAQIGFLYGANFSIGMNLFSRLVSHAVEVFDSFADYDLYALEKHHAQKQDSPSGTALELAKLILAASTHKSKVLWDKLDRRPEPDEFHFASVRGGSVPGTHSLCFDSVADTIELNHIVRSRATFALGALMAARWIAGKKGVYSFSEMIQEILC
ncbi:MAG: 4-hydroxy-tetrahydrodipicolinate reductase [Candidatus Cloacimonetes bacterium]|jgi:4-hydroxy-tetrahydrodipicolinate reductase|nr:4-hydroxy-tetrahydrodipicolinate reductase [Candidatus Cloacimonadota bacterium]MDY0228720.1 4-hydroxy-tetrahydrodipicolinate reductase [Candidatus Cloacimonadaceae bacterium]